MSEWANRPPPSSEPVELFVLYFHDNRAQRSFRRVRHSFCWFVKGPVGVCWSDFCFAQPAAPTSLWQHLRITPMQQLLLYFYKYYLPKLPLFYFPGMSAPSSYWLERFLSSFLLYSGLIIKAATLRPLKRSSVCFSCSSCWDLNTEELLFRLRSARLERRCARATHLCLGGVSKNLLPVSAVPRWLLSLNMFTWERDVQAETGRVLRLQEQTKKMKW